MNGHRQKCLAVLLALSLLTAAALPAHAEETEKDSAPQVKSVTAEETLLEPVWPVPEYVTWLLETAAEELGYTEDRSGVTKYGIWSGDPTAEWCAEFVCWCVDQVDQEHHTQLLTRQYPKYFSSNVGRDWFLREGRYVARKGIVPEWGSQWFTGESEQMGKNSYIPQPGDWMFFSTAASGDTTHVAMVEYCARDTLGTVWVHVIEGNNPDRVQRKAYPIDNWAILGYGTVRDVADVTIRSGNEGRKVTLLQEKLALLGYLDAQYVTGKYASLTARAVSAFQKDHQLNETGVANQSTQLRLNEAVRMYYMETPAMWTVEE